MGYYSIKDELNARKLNSVVLWIESWDVDVKLARISRDGKRVDITIMLQPVVNEIVLDFNFLAGEKQG